MIHNQSNSIDFNNKSIKVYPFPLKSIGDPKIHKAPNIGSKKGRPKFQANCRKPLPRALNYVVPASAEKIIFNVIVLHQRSSALTIMLPTCDPAAVAPPRPRENCSRVGGHLFASNVHKPCSHASVACGQ